MTIYTYTHSKHLSRRTGTTGTVGCQTDGARVRLLK